VGFGPSLTSRQLPAYEPSGKFGRKFQLHGPRLASLNPALRATFESVEAFQGQIRVNLPGTLPGVILPRVFWGSRAGVSGGQCPSGLHVCSCGREWVWSTGLMWSESKSTAAGCGGSSNRTGPRVDGGSLRRPSNPCLSIGAVSRTTPTRSISGLGSVGSGPRKVGLDSSAPRTSIELDARLKRGHPDQQRACPCIGGSWRHDGVRLLHESLAGHGSPPR
jgi:hypothetical protein